MTVQIDRKDKQAVKDTVTLARDSQTEQLELRRQLLRHQVGSATIGKGARATKRTRPKTRLRTAVKRGPMMKTGREMKRKLKKKKKGEAKSMPSMLTTQGTTGPRRKSRQKEMLAVANERSVRSSKRKTHKKTSTFLSSTLH